MRVLCMDGWCRVVRRPRRPRRRPWASRAPQLSRLLSPHSTTPPRHSTMTTCTMYKITYVAKKKQLEERGAALVDSLFERRSGRVTFSQFRNGLLAVLGDKQPAPPAPPDPPPAPVSGAAPSDDDSSGREVAPRFVFGSKKYGRRSRPQQSSEPEERNGVRAASTSRLEARARPRCRRSASAMDGRDDDTVPPALEHDRRIDREEALALCRDLRMDAVDRRIVERAFEDSIADTTVGEFFERLNSTLARTMEDVNVSGPPEIVEEDDEDVNVAPEVIAEVWERAGIRRPRRLLAELGFANGNLRPAELERALDEELRAMADTPDDRSAVLVAAHALSRMRAVTARRRADRIAAERDKLRMDVAEANRRAQLLAQEVDENHARIETELKTSLKRAEARYAEEARRASVEAATERERSNVERIRLEADVVRRNEVESRLRAELAELQRRAEELETRAATADEQLEVAERERSSLSERLREAQAREQLAAETADAAHAATARLEELQTENQKLRDRVDELVAELETTTLNTRVAGETTPSPDLGNLCVELSAAFEPEKSQQENHTTMSSTQDEVDRVAYVDEEKQKLTDLVKELETSLEAMRAEYESCEEYWSGKLNEERIAHDAEQRASDERLTELVARITEFERRLAPPSLPPIEEAAALEAQVEQLEAEYSRQRRADAARLRVAHEQLTRAHRRLAALQRRRAPPPVAAACRCAALAERCRRLEAALAAGGAMAARCARAETAVRRLQARLVAADLLVKDLYVENSELARRRPP